MAAPTPLSWLPEIWKHEATTSLVEAGTGTLDNVTSTRATDRAVSRADSEDVSGIRFTGVAPSVTGISSGWEGRRLGLLASGGPLVLVDQGGSSDAANRIDCGGADVTIAEGAATWLVYDNGRWHLATGGAPTAPAGAPGELQYNNSGSFAGTPDFYIDAEGQLVVNGITYHLAGDGLLTMIGTGRTIDAGTTDHVGYAKVNLAGDVSVDMRGFVLVHAMAVWGGGRSVQIVMQEWQLVAGVLSLVGVPEDMTPAGRADAVVKVSFDVYAPDTHRWVKVLGRAADAGDTAWSCDLRCVGAIVPA